MTPPDEFDFASAATAAMAVIFLGALLLAAIRSIRHAGQNDWMVSALRSKPREYRPSVLAVCPTCGYDLRASPLLCPECGHDNGAVVVVPVHVLQERLAESTRVLTHRVAVVRPLVRSADEAKG